MSLPALRAKQTTITTGTGDLTLIAAGTGWVNFADVLGASARRIRYLIRWSSGFEAGIGAFDGASPGTLARSNPILNNTGLSGSAVNLPAGTKEVYAWAEPGETTVKESSATSLTLALTDLGSILHWTGSSDITVALPAKASVPPGNGFHIVNRGSANIIIDPNSSETINGVTTITLAPGQGAFVYQTSTGWFTAEVSDIAGGGADKGFTLHDVTLNSSFAIPSGKNAGTFGPVTIASGATITVPTGSVWSIV